MTLEDFIKKYNGKYVEISGSTARFQCVDLANLYLREVLSLPIIAWTNAIDFPKKAGDKYDYILNTPEGVPQRGDLVVFDGKYGHISIFVEGNTKRFTSFDQNFPTGSPAHLHEHNYTNPRVLGWLRPKPQEQMVTLSLTELDKMRRDRDEHWNDLQNTLQDLARCNETTDNLNNLLNDKNNQIAELQGQISSLSTQLSACQQEKDSLVSLAKRVPPLEKMLTQAEHDRDVCLDAQEAMNKRIAQLANTSYKTTDTKVLVQELLTRLVSKIGGEKNAKS